MEKTFENILKENTLLDKNKHVLLAVSGGVDSIVLFHLLASISEKKRPQVSIAHINHQLRPEATSDETFVKKLAETYNLPFYSYTWEKSEQPKSGTEEAARKMRYTFFKEVMAQHKIDALMTGHHQDDQVETILMKLARGSSLAQLTGIKLTQPFQNGLLVRPLLPFPKAELYDFAHKHHLKYVEDATNQELTYSRNRFRNQIIPLLKEENAQFNEHLTQFKEDLQDLIDIAKPEIDRTVEDLVLVEASSISLRAKDFLKLSEAMQRAVLQRILETLYANRVVSYKTNYIEIVREWLLRGEVNTTLDLIGAFKVRKGYNEVTFYEQSEVVSSIEDERVRIEQLNEWVKLSETEAIGLFEHDGAEGADGLLFEEGSVEFPLTVRHRKPGDRMAYAGLDGTKKIKDIFIDEKVPLAERDRAWLVEDATGVIVWLVGFRKRHLLSAQETDKLTYILKYKKM